MATKGHKKRNDPWLNRLRASCASLWQLKPLEPAHLRSGKWGEKRAVKLLKSKGWKIVGERVRAGKRDEIDIIADDGAALVFVEVKTRKNERFGRPFAAVDKEKRKRLSRAAVAYLKKERLQPNHIRFDVVEVVGEPGARAPELRHIENAFPLDARYKLWW